MAPDISRTSSKRKRTALDSQATSDGGNRLLKAARAVNDASKSRNADRTSVDEEGDAPQELRRVLAKLFAALEATLISSPSQSSTFHAIQRAVTTTARCQFGLHHLAQMLGAWPEVYEVEPVMALVNDTRVPSLSISIPVGNVASSTSPSPSFSLSQRQREFKLRLASWSGEDLGTLPDLKKLHRVALDTAKIASIKKKPVVESSSSLPVSSSSVAATNSDVASSSPSAKARTSALLDRIRERNQRRRDGENTQLGPEQMKEATIAALVPLAVSSIKVLLASRTRKVVGMTELRDNLVTSLGHRLGGEDVERLVEHLSRRKGLNEWCKIGRVGDVKVVRFLGPVPTMHDD